jgi:CRP-like cAMP-binding protein
MAEPGLLESRISQNPVLGVLPPAVRRRVAAAASVRSFRRSQVVARELEPSSQFLLVLEGSAGICRYSEDGRKTIFRTVHPPAGIGYLLLCGEPHTAEVVAQDGLRIALIPTALLTEIFRSHPEALYKSVARLAELVDTLSSEILEERTLPLPERVRRAIYRNADAQGILRMSHEELAACVGATRANISRAVKQLEASGAVSLGRREIRINRTS